MPAGRVKGKASPARLRPAGGDVFSMTVPGEKHTERKEAGRMPAKEILTLFQLQQEGEIHLATISGFDLVYRASGSARMMVIATRPCSSAPVQIMRSIGPSRLRCSVPSHGCSTLLKASATNSTIIASDLKTPSDWSPAVPETEALSRSKTSLRKAAEAGRNRGSNGGKSGRRDRSGVCMAALHNKCFPAGQNSGIAPSADAHDGHLSVPSQQLFLSGGFRSPHFMGRGFRRPIFLFFVRLIRRFRGVYAEAAFAQAPPSGSLKSDYIKVPFAHGLHVDISAGPFLQQGNEGRIRVDRHTTRCRAINRTLRVGSAGFGICAHTASPDI